ncbi:hypothetical protein B9Z19DRAFT_990274 [Tuber borchii]|uniref:NAD(P)-binding protein n=1 Tax=Tuber borchii TaxID=42251 RepID=A0A2T6ZM14_TUBBO|nr:hypothetical protein B9Z19DRAFT_990274 [Tuber borchii]
MPKTWFITGASSGIGREISLAALSRGDTVITTSRTPETHLSDLSTRGATTLKLDLTSPYSEIASVVAEALRQHENIDILVNVAGYLLEGSVEETNEEIEHLYKTNLFGPINLARALLPHFRARRAGVVANVAGIGALRGAAAAGYYCASKAALRVVTEALRAEVAAFGIEVCCVMLGHFRTNFLDQGHRLAVRGRIDEYEDVLGGIRRGFSAFHGRQPGDPVKAGNVIVRVLAGDGGLGVPAVLPVGGDVFEKIEEGCARAIGEVEGLKEVAGYTDLQGVGES